MFHAKNLIAALAGLLLATSAGAATVNSFTTSGGSTVTGGGSLNSGEIEMVVNIADDDAIVVTFNVGATESITDFDVLFSFPGAGNTTSNLNMLFVSGGESDPWASTSDADLADGFESIFEGPLSTTSAAAGNGCTIVTCFHVNFSGLDTSESTASLDYLAIPGVLELTIGMHAPGSHFHLIIDPGTLDAGIPAPIPGAAWLLISAFAGLGILRRRRGR
ncbi:MAG: hypothetical protein AAF493_25190 [Pseudomonadota bacterium]